MTVRHILEDGRIESHEEAVTRLLRELGLQNGHLFRSLADIINEAYERRGRQIAYAEREDPAHGSLREVVG